MFGPIYEPCSVVAWLRYVPHNLDSWAMPSMHLDISKAKTMFERLFHNNGVP